MSGLQPFGRLVTVNQGLRRVLLQPWLLYFGPVGPEFEYEHENARGLRQSYSLNYFLLFTAFTARGAQGLVSWAGVAP